jgi:hypothetical protein
VILLTSMRAISPFSSEFRTLTRSSMDVMTLAGSMLAPQAALDAIYRSSRAWDVWTREGEGEGRIRSREHAQRHSPARPYGSPSLRPLWQPREPGPPSLGLIRCLRPPQLYHHTKRGAAMQRMQSREAERAGGEAGKPRCDRFQESLGQLLQIARPGLPNTPTQSPFPL